MFQQQLRRYFLPLFISIAGLIGVQAVYAAQSNLSMTSSSICFTQTPYPTNNAMTRTAYATYYPTHTPPPTQTPYPTNNAMTRTAYATYYLTRTPPPTDPTR